MSVFDPNPLFLADVMAAADHMVEEICERHPLEQLDRRLLAQAIEDRAWGWLVARNAEKQEASA